MKNMHFRKPVIINICLVFCIVAVSVIYSKGGGFKLLNVFLNTQKEIPIYSVETSEKKVALSFDASWGDQYTDQILDILDKNNIKSTFFLVGGWADKYPDKVKKIFLKGHEIGNHSNTHPHLTQLSEDKMKEEICSARDKIKSITGKDTLVFRPPFGDYNSDVVKAIKETGHFCIQWDVDSEDWMNPGEDVIYKRVIDKTGKGSILLFHNNEEQTPKVLDRIIKKLKSEGYSFVKISDLIYKDNYYVDHTGRQRLINN